MKKKLSLTVKTRQYFKSEFLTELSAALMVALGIKVFSAPNLIVGGGVSGIASVLYVLFGLPIGAVSLALNLPLLFIAWRELGNRFTFRTLRVVAIISVVTDIVLKDMPAYSGEKLIAAIFAGVFLGAGLGIILYRGDSTGGTDIIVKLIQRRYRHISLGSIVMITDAAVVAAAAWAYKNIDTILYGSIMIFVSSAVIDKIILGAQVRKLSLIITAKGEEVTNKLLSQLNRGVTVINGKGGYTKADVSLLICAASASQTIKLKQIVYAVDNSAFIIIANAAETLGKGFKRIDEI
ncbi:MAG: YitT family protein [Clostridia bacterium]|nr:YitT family protein [Clostridia bacterium]